MPSCLQVHKINDHIDCTTHEMAMGWAMVTFTNLKSVLVAKSMQGAHGFYRI